MTFDVVIIGAGSAGFAAAEAARERGAAVCIVEREKLGGECPNWACIPTKALLKAARVYRATKRASDFGVIVRRVEFDFAQVMAYKDRVVAAITGGGEVGKRYEELLRELEITFVAGTARFIDKQTIAVTGKDGGIQEVTAKAFVIATGTAEFVPPISGLPESSYLTFKEAVSLKKLPASIAIIGAGPVGCEFATFFASFGVATTLIQRADVVLSREDREIAELAGRALEAMGVTVRTGAEIVSVGVAGKTKTVVLKDGTVHVESILLAAGKRARVEGLGLDTIKVKLDKQGDLLTDDRGATSLSHIFAAGDVDGGLQFTHTAHHKGTIAGTNAALKALGKTKGFLVRDLSVVPRVTFVEPEIASVGMTSEEAKKAFGSTYIGRFPLSALGRSVTDSSAQGRVKLIAHPKTGVVVGGCIQGHGAGEMIHEVALAIRMKATLYDLADMMHAFPTFSEAISGAASTVEVI